MNVLDANVVIGFLDASNAQHAHAVEVLQALGGGPFVMHEVTLAEVLAGPAHLGRATAGEVWSSMLQMGIEPARSRTTPLEVALLRASTGLPIPDCLVISAAGEPSDANTIVTFDARLAAKARELGYAVAP